MISRGISTAATGLVAAVLLAHSVPVSAAQPAVRAGHVIHRAAKAPQAFKTNSGGAQPSTPAASPRVLPVIGGAWTSLGPTTISPENSTGRALALIVNGTNLFIGGADGGIWKTTLPVGASPTWTPLTDGAASTNLAIQSFAIDPNATSRMYAGTGELATSIDSRYGQGVYVSTDSGSTWTLQNPGGMFTNLSISALAVDSAGTIYAATAQHLVAAASGLYKSTDHGVTWNLFPSLLTGQDVTDLAIGSDNTIYAAVGDPGGSAATNGIWRSVGGAAFTNTTSSLVLNGTYRWRLAMPSRALTASQVLWAVAGNNSSGDLQAVIQTANGGVAWVDRSGTGGTSIVNEDLNNPVNQAWYNLLIAADPSDQLNTVYVGTHDLYKTGNGSAANPAWADITNVYGGPSGFATPANIHPDQHALILSSGTLFAGDDGGLYISSNGGTTWGPRNGNLNLAQFYGGAVAANPSQVLGGLQDNGSIYTATGGPTWTDQTSGDGFFVAIDPTNSNHAYAEYPFGGLDISVAGPTAFPQTGIDPSSGSEPAEFVADLVLDPNNPAVVYSARHQLWRSADHGVTWLPSNPTNLSTPTNCFSPGCIHRIAIAPGNSNEIFVIGTGGNVSGDDTYRTTTGPGGVWTQVDGTPSCATPTDLSPKSCAQTNNGGVTDVAVDGQNNQVVYETDDGFSGGGHHVFKSIDAGAHWADVSSSLPDVPFNTVVVNSGVVYTGSDRGVYVSLDAGASWNLLGTSLPNARVLFLVVQSSKVFAFTHGRGAWQIVAPSQPSSRTPALPAPSTPAPTRDAVKPNPPTGMPPRPAAGRQPPPMVAAPGTVAGAITPELAPGIVDGPAPASRSWSDLQNRRQRWAF